MSTATCSTASPRSRASPGSSSAARRGPRCGCGCSPGRLAAFGLTPGDIENALRRQNVELPAGRLESAQQNVTLRVDRPFANARQFAQLVVGRGTDGYLVRLGDVARVEQGPENPYSAFRLNGQEAVGLGIVRQSGANTLAVAEAAKAAAEELKPTLPEGMNIVVGSDESLFISRAIDKVWETLAEAAVLVVLVIYLFLGNWRATLIPGRHRAALPARQLRRAVAVRLLDQPSHPARHGAVDRDRRRRRHRRARERLSPDRGRRAAARRRLRGDAAGRLRHRLDNPGGLRGVRADHVHRRPDRPAVPRAGGGDDRRGRLLRLPRAQPGADALLEAAPISRSAAASRAGSTTASAGSRASTRAALDGVIRKPLVPLVVVGLFLAGVGLPVLDPAVRAGAGRGRRHPLRQRHRAGRDRLRADGPLHARRAGQAAAARRRRARCARSSSALRAASAPATISTAALSSSSSSPGRSARRPPRTSSQEVNRRLGQLPAVRGNAQVRSSIGGRGRGQPVSFVIAGATYAELARARDRILAAAAANPGIVNLDSDYKETKPQLRIAVDTARAGDLGVSVEDVCNALQKLLGSRRVSTYVDRGEEYRVDRPGRGRRPGDRGQSPARSTSAAGRGDAGPARQPGHRQRHGRRPRSRPLQQDARDHLVRRPRAGLFARRGARPSSRRRRAPVARGDRGRLSRREPGLQGSRRLDLAGLRAHHPDRLPAARRPVRELRPSRRDHHHGAAGGRRAA